MAIEKNQIVSIEYEVSDGEKVVDSNIGGMPLVFMFGRGQIIPGLENAISNMSIGVKRQKLLVKRQRMRTERMRQKQNKKLPRDQFAGIELEVGMTLYGQGEDGGTVQVVVQDIGDESVIIDFNHPLAGKDLVFLVGINNIREASTEEMMSGIPVENQHDDCCGTGGGTGCGC